MQVLTWRKYAAICVLILLGASLRWGSASNRSTPKELTYSRQVRAISTVDAGVSDPANLAFSSAANAFLILDAQPQQRSSSSQPSIVLLSPYADPIGTIQLPTRIADPLNVAFDEQTNQLLFFDPDLERLGAILIETTGSSRLSAQINTRFAAPTFGLVHPQGMTIDQQGRRLFMLDSLRRRIIGFTLDRHFGFGDMASTDNIELTMLEQAQFRGIVFNPNTGHLYLMSPVTQRLYEVTTTGELLTSWDLASFRLSDVQAMIFAPSGDPTDDPLEKSLYLIDSGSGAGQGRWQSHGQIVEITLTPPVPALQTANSMVASLIRTIDTSQWSPPSPDPADITYLPNSQRLLISDSEVDEMPQYFTGDNLFESARNGVLMDTASTLSFSHEPSGVAFNPNNFHRFFSDDNAKEVIEQNPGSDNLIGTADDVVTSFSTRMFNSLDPESLAFGQNQLFIADGLGKEIYIVSPGNNSVFDGVAPSGDDQVSHFDVEKFGQVDPEGIEFNSDRGTLFIVSRDRKSQIIETTISGALIGAIDISALRAENPSGLAYAPSSVDSHVMSLYMSDRGIDNNPDPQENDGKVYEIALSEVVSTTTPTATHTPTPRLRPTSTPTAIPISRTYKSYTPIIIR
jgi:hypothetical protein